MTNLLKTHVLDRLLSQIVGPRKRRSPISLRNSLEDLESRALLSAVGGEALDAACDVQTIQAVSQGRAVPRIDGVAGTFEISGGDIGNGSLTITQEGQQIAGTFDTSNIIEGSFNAQFKTAKARVARGTAQFVYVGEEVAENFKFTIRFKKNGDFSFRYR